MKRFLIILHIFFIVQTSYGQACGIYRIKHTGTIVNQDIEVVKVKLPTPPFLHGLEEFNSERGHIEGQVIKNRFELTLSSHLTSQLHDNADIYLKLYRSHIEKIPIVLTLKGGREVLIHILFPKIDMIKIEDGGFGSLFELNFNKIEISN